MSGTKNDHTCPECKNHYSTAYSMYRHMRKVHNCDTNRSVTLYCPIENCNQSYDRYNALDTHLSHVHYADIRKEQFTFSDLQDFETWLRDITSSSKTKYIKRSCNNSYRYYRCHRSGVPKTSREKILNGEMKSSVKIGRHCPSRIIAKITERNVQVEFVPTHIGHECEIAKIPLSQKKRHDIACRLANSTRGKNNSLNPEVAAPPVSIDNDALPPTQQSKQSHLNVTNATGVETSSVITTNEAKTNSNHHQGQQQTNEVSPPLIGITTGVTSQLQSQRTQSAETDSNNPACGVQASSTIISDDTSHLISLSPMKTTRNVQSSQQQLGVPMHQISQAHLMQVATTQMDSRPAHSNNGNTTSMSLMSLTTPTRQELTARFEQLMAAIQSDKHASIVRAQLEVCFALIID